MDDNRDNHDNEENRSSIADIVDQWTIRHNERFKGEQRKIALEELMNTFAYHGYGRASVTANKNKILEALWNKNWNGKHKKEWRESSLKAIETAISCKFAPVYFPDFQVPVKFEPGEDQTFSQNETAAPLQAQETDNSDIPKDETAKDDRWSPALYFAPELDRSKLKDVKTTEIMSDEEFFAILEREKNER